MPKKRLDLLLVEKGLVQSRPRARALIMSGSVLVNNQKVDKPGIFVTGTEDIFIKGQDHPYVSRGGLKLEGALSSLQVPVKGLFCLDVGASTGGFSDCLLQHGAKHVFAVDVGYGQLAWTLRQDSRVTVLERTNIRHLSADALPCRVDLITIDVSFISLKVVVPAVLKFLNKDGQILALVKPQFEVGKGNVGKGGVVRDPSQHQEVIQNLADFFTTIGLRCENTVPSPILGPKGNREFFFLLTASEPPALN
jgi:23S rRNA (cytidine1920-2'-O)/16S rRNA (cytidine1409-2'-O)-methyltransferase